MIAIIDYDAGKYAGAVTFGRREKRWPLSADMCSLQ